MRQIAVLIPFLLLVTACRQSPQSPQSAQSAAAPLPTPTPFAAEPATQMSREQSVRGEAGQRTSRGHNSGEIDGAQPGQFDFYLLTLSWSPAYCATRPSDPECAGHPGFLVHGLWPEDFSGQYPADCPSSFPAPDPHVLDDIMPDQLITHEWPKHGTCSGLDPNAYVAAIRTAFNEVQPPAAIANATQQISLTPQAVITDFAQANPGFPAGSFAVSCANNTLSAVTACLDKQLHPIACQNVHSCGGTRITVIPR